MEIDLIIDKPNVLQKLGLAFIYAHAIIFSSSLPPPNVMQCNGNQRRKRSTHSATDSDEKRSSGAWGSALLWRKVG